MKRLVFSACAITLALAILTGCAEEAPEEADDQAPEVDAEPQNEADDDAGAEPAAPDVNATAADYDCTITIVVPFGPGGGNDTYGRLAAEHLGRHLPNDNNVIVENVEGGGGRVGAMHVNRADADGCTMLIGPLPSLPVAQVIDDDFDVDFADWDFLGSFHANVVSTLVASDSEYQTLEEIRGARMGVPGMGSSTGIHVGITNDVLDMEWDFVSFDGAAETAVALIRGDVDAAQILAESAAEFIESGDLRPLLVYTDDRLEAPFEDVPTSVELEFPEELAKIQVDLTLSFPPGVDPAIVSLLRDAFWEMVHDDEFLAGAEAVGRPVSPKNGETTQQLAMDSLNQFSARRDLLEELFALD